MACNCSLVQNSINPQQISKQSRTLPSFYYHIKYSWCKLKRNVSQMPILILLSFKILVTLTLAFNKANARNTRSRPKASRQGQGQKIWPRGQGQGQGLTTLPCPSIRQCGMVGQQFTKCLIFTNYCPSLLKDNTRHGSFNCN